MTINTVSNSNINNGRRQAPSPVPPLPLDPIIVPAYVRPIDWLTLPTIGSTESKFVGLTAIYDVNSNYVAITCTCTGGYTVDWGDGIVQNFGSTATAVHNYVYADISAGSLSTRGYRQAIVTVTPTVETNNFTLIDINIVGQGNLPKYATRWLDIAIGGPQLSTLKVGGATTLVNHSMLEQFSLISCGSNTSLSNLFAQCYKLQSVPVFNTTNITTSTFDANSMFYQCYSLTTVPASIDFTKHNNFFQMFTDCKSLVYFPAINSPNNTLTRFMFSGCNSLRAIEPFDVSKVTNAQSMFNACPNLQYVPDLNFSTLLTNCDTMFATCRSLISAPFINTFNVTTCGSMFSGCYSLISVPAYDFRKVIGLSSIFNDCRSIINFPNLNLNVATDISGAFTNCYSMQTSPYITGTNNITNCNNMFNGCQSLTNVILFNTANVTTMSSMFANCFSLVEIPEFNTIKVTDIQNMFQNCASFKILPSLNLANVYTASSTFNGCTALIQLPELNTSNLTIASTMFQNCSSLKVSPVMNTSKCTFMNSVFSGCSALKTVPLYNTSNATTIAGMFSNCLTLEEIPLIDTSKVTAAGFNGPFNGCSSIYTLPAFNTNGITSGSTITTLFNNTLISLVEIPAMNMANVTTYSGGSIGGGSLARIKLTNINFTLAVPNQVLSKDAIEEVCTNLVGNATVKTFTITSNPGVDTAVAKTGNTNLTSTTIVMTNTVGITTGMYIIGNGVSTGVFNHNGFNVVTNTQPLEGTPIAFNAFTNATNLSLYTVYYVKNSFQTGFGVSLTPGGAQVNFNNTSTAGTCSYRFTNQVVTVTPNVSITMSSNCTAQATAVAISGRILNTTQAVMKNWTVTG